MNKPNFDFPSDKLHRLMLESARRSSSLHRQFLQVRQDSLQNMHSIIQMQIAAGLPLKHPGQDSSTAQGSYTAHALFTNDQLDAFGTGQISKCLGPAFARYDAHRIPRIPNGDLKMMSRVRSITGTRGNFSAPSSIVVDYDVPADAWYLQEGVYPDMPYSLYMEIALQPCGFLSAYLDTYALVPYEAYFFRNLDGSAQVLERVDLRGQTITTHARMITSVVSSGTVIQKFAFELVCAGKTVYAGESTFGYFAAQTMLNQVGLDGGQTVLPTIKTNRSLSEAAHRLDLGPYQNAPAGRPYERLAAGRLHFIDEVSMARKGGRFGQGYIYASRAVNPRDWFYPFHFYQDPVMPGSLGVEAILEAMQVYALANDLGRGLLSPRFGMVAGATPMLWRYRGQITQQHKLMELEVDIQRVEREAGQVTIRGDASLWVDSLRIYEVKNAAVAILEAKE